MNQSSATVPQPSNSALNSILPNPPLPTSLLIANDPTFIIVEHQNFHDSWPSIRTSILTPTKRSTINPFQDYKAVLHTYDASLAQHLLSSDSWMIIGKHNLRFHAFDDLSSHQNTHCATYGGWIEIVDLPISLWTESISRYIGDQCGSYLETSSRTQLGINLIAALNTRGFILSSIKIPPSLAGSEAVVQIKGHFIENGYPGHINEKAKIKEFDLIAIDDGFKRTLLKGKNVCPDPSAESSPPTTRKSPSPSFS